MRVVAKDPTTRARARLFLRSEAAMGQVALPLKKAQRAGSEQAEKPGAADAKGEKSSGAASIGAQKPNARSSIALQQVPAAIRQAGSGDSVDIFVAQGAAAMPGLSREEKIRLLAQLHDEQVRNCDKCRLWEKRTQTVFGEGDVDAAIFFIGEGPGETEDKTGRPFVGRAGQLLDQMIAAMGLKREQVYIANIVKCRPPDNRTPAPDEVETCSPFLVRQLEIVRPKVIVTLGLPAAKYMFNPTQGITRTRGNWQQWRGIRLMPTFHPAFLLRSYTVENRQAVWSDLQKVMDEIGLKPKKSRVQEAV
jgi:DNA polymerase